jgi:threonine dehydrogenase-like Zn-dependent dehydrogenase
VQALVTEPGVEGTTRVEEIGAEKLGEELVPVRVLEVGVCGTDREISHGLFGIPPPGDSELVIGHELLGVVDRDGHGFARGDLVTATVRRSCGRCRACLEGSPDSCLTGAYDERGITRLHGFARELVGEDPSQLVPIPASLGQLGVLAEPASVCARAIRHARAIGDRQPWEPQRALVIGAGAVGALASVLLRLDGMEVWVAALEPADSPRASLIEAFGSRYVSTASVTLSQLRDEVGGFDLVIEAAGDAQIMIEAISLLRRSGVACVLGLDPRDRDVRLPGRVLGVDTILGNRVVFGSVNARREDMHAAVAALDAARMRWPEPVDAMVGLRVPLDRFGDAFDHRGGGIKATLVVSET